MPVWVGAGGEAVAEHVDALDEVMLPDVEDTKFDDVDVMDVDNTFAGELLVGVLLGDTLDPWAVEVDVVELAVERVDAELLDDRLGDVESDELDAVELAVEAVTAEPLDERLIDVESADIEDDEVDDEELSRVLLTEVLLIDRLPVAVEPEDLEDDEVRDDELSEVLLTDMLLLAVDSRLEVSAIAVETL